MRVSRRSFLSVAVVGVPLLTAAKYCSGETIENYGRTLKYGKVNCIYLDHRQLAIVDRKGSESFVWGRSGSGISRSTDYIFVDAPKKIPSQIAIDRITEGEKIIIPTQEIAGIYPKETSYEDICSELETIPYYYARRMSTKIMCSIPVEEQELTIFYRADAGNKVTILPTHQYVDSMQIKIGLVGWIEVGILIQRL